MNKSEAEKEIVLLGYARTPFGRFDARFAEVTLPSLGAESVKVALARAGLRPDDVDEIAIGVNFPGSNRSIARQVALRADIPSDRVAYTIDRACCSSLTAAGMVARALRTGDASIGVAGGTENLSSVPYALKGLRFGVHLGPVVVEDSLVITCPHTGVPRAVQAGEEAIHFGVNREAQDRWALRSHERYIAATRIAGLEEIAPTTISDALGREVQLDVDECVRTGTSLERLASLPTVYGSPTVTAGNAPNLSTGSSALVLGTAASARDFGVAPLARFRVFVEYAGDPHRIASIPGHTAALALERARLDVDDVDVIEINEAFAAVPLVSTLVLTGGDEAKADKLRERTNMNGGAIAIGHPTGATGARLVMAAVSELRRRGGGLGLVSICGGVGEAAAAVLEV